MSALRQEGGHYNIPLQKGHEGVAACWEEEALLRTAHYRTHTTTPTSCLLCHGTCTASATQPVLLCLLATFHMYSTTDIYLGGRSIFWRRRCSCLSYGGMPGIQWWACQRQCWA